MAVCILTVFLNWYRVQAAVWALDRTREISAAALPTGGYVPGELLVKFRLGVTEGRIERILDVAGAEKIQSVTTIRLYRVKIADPGKVPEALRILRSFSEVEYAEPNYLENQPAPQ